MANVNLYTYNPYVGVTSGIKLFTNAVNPRTGRIAPPQIQCGGGFIAAEKQWNHLPLDRNGRLMAASLHQITPISGGKPFEVLVPWHRGSTMLYCYVESIPPAGVKPRVRPEEVRARYLMQATDGVRVILQDQVSQSFLLEFSQDGDEVDIWYENGHISRLAREAGRIVTLRLQPEEIAELRVEQLNEQLAEMKGGVEVDNKRRYGIIAGAVRLLRIVNDHAAQDVFVNFLLEQQTHLTSQLRAEVRALLLEQGNPFAGNFLVGWTPNVVQLRSSLSEEERERRAAAEKRRLENRARRDAECQARKGANGGGGGGKNRNGKR